MEKLFKKNRNKIIILLIFIVIFYIICFSKFRMYNLPQGEYIESLDSPNEAYTLKAYRYSGGATVDWSLRVEVVNNSNNKSTNIYYKYHEYDVDMKWLNKETVIINGIELNIFKDYYYK